MTVDVAHPESGINSPYSRLTSVVAADRTSKDNAILGSNGVSTHYASFVTNQKIKQAEITPPQNVRKH